MTDDLAIAMAASAGEDWTALSESHKQEWRRHAARWREGMA